MKYPATFKLVQNKDEYPSQLLIVEFDGIGSGTIVATNIKGYRVGQHAGWWASHTKREYWEPMDDIWVDGFGVCHDKIKGETI